MSYLLYFGLIVIQLTSILAIQPLPLKCFLRDNNFLALFDKSNVYASPYDIPTVNPPSLDNLKVDFVKINRDGFLLETKDIQFQGLNDAILDDIGFNLNSNISYLTFHSDMLVKNLYKTDGSLFFLPISGEGSCEIYLKNIQIGMVIPFDIIDVNGKNFIELKNFDYWYDVKENAKFNTTNLYYGDTERSKIMQYLINQNWKFITVQYGKYFMDKLIENVFNMYRNYLLAMPLRDFATC